MPVGVGACGCGCLWVWVPVGVGVGWHLQTHQPTGNPQTPMCLWYPEL